MTIGKARKRVLSLQFQHQFATVMTIIDQLSACQQDENNKANRYTHSPHAGTHEQTRSYKLTNTKAQNRVQFEF